MKGKSIKNDFLKFLDLNLEQLNEKYNEINDNLRELDVKNQSLESDMKKEIENVQSKAEKKIEDEINELKSLKDIVNNQEGQLLVLEKKKLELNAQYEALNKKLREYDEDIQQKTIEVAEIKKTAPFLDESIGKNKKQLEEELAVKEKDIMLINSKIKDLEDKMPKTGFLSRFFSNNQNTINQSDIEDYKIIIGTHQEVLKNNEKQKEELESQILNIEKIEELNNNILKSSTDIDRNRNSLVELKSQIDEIDNQIKQLGNDNKINNDSKQILEKKFNSLDTSDTFFANLLTIFTTDKKRETIQDIINKEIEKESNEIRQNTSRIEKVTLINKEDNIKKLKACSKSKDDLNIFISKMKQLDPNKIDLAVKALLLYNFNLNSAFTKTLNHLLLPTPDVSKITKILELRRELKNNPWQVINNIDMNSLTSLDSINNSLKEKANSIVKIYFPDLDPEFSDLNPKNNTKRPHPNFNIIKNCIDTSFSYGVSDKIMKSFSSTEILNSIQTLQKDLNSLDNNFVEEELKSFNSQRIFDDPNAIDYAKLKVELMINHINQWSVDHTDDLIDNMKEKIKAEIIKGEETYTVNNFKDFENLIEVYTDRALGINGDRCYFNKPFDFPEVIQGLDDIGSLSYNIREAFKRLDNEKNAYNEKLKTAVDNYKADNSEKNPHITDDEYQNIKKQYDSIERERISKIENTISYIKEYISNAVRLLKETIFKNNAYYHAFQQLKDMKPENLQLAGIKNGLNNFRSNNIKNKNHSYGRGI